MSHEGSCDPQGQGNLCRDDPTRDEPLLNHLESEAQARIGALVVSQDGSTVLGIVSERDIVYGLAEHGPKLLALPVSEVMTSRVVTCTPEDNVTAIMARMTRYRVRHLPVVQDGK